VFVFCDILLSPLVFETRGASILGSSASLPWFGLLVLGLMLNILALVVLFFRPRGSSILAILGSAVYIVVILGDQVGLVTPVAAPPLIRDVEVVTFFVLVAAIFYSSKIYRGNRAG